MGVLKVRELHGAVEDAKASKGVLVCARGFTPDAKKWVKRNPRLELVGAATRLFHRGSSGTFAGPFRVAEGIGAFRARGAA